MEERDATGESPAGGYWRWGIRTAAGAFLVAALCLNRFVVGSEFSQLGYNSAWFGIAAIVLCSFSSAVCATRWRSLNTLLLAFFFADLTIYMINVVGTYDSGGTYGIVSRITGPTIPLAFPLWFRFSLQVIEDTPHSDEAQGFARTTMSVLERITHWQRFFGRVSLAEILFVWLPGVLFAVLELVPGLVYSNRGPIPGQEWRGYWTFHVTSVYWVMGAWAVCVMGLSAFLLLASWRARGAGLLPGAAERARWAPWLIISTFTLTVLTAASATAGTWPEPAIDFLIAIFFVAFALIVIDADAYRDAGQTFSSLRTRLLATIIWCVLAFALVALTHGSYLRYGVTAALLGAGLPLVSFAARDINGNSARRETNGGGADIERAERLTALLITPFNEPPQGVRVSDSLRRTSEMLETFSGADLRKLIGSLPSERGRGNEFGDPRSEPRLARFVASFPPLGGAGVWELRLMQLARLIYQTAETYDAFELNTRPRIPPVGAFWPATAWSGSGKSRAIPTSA